MAVGDNWAALLRSFIERIERLQEERGNLGEDLRGVYAEARDLHGFDIKALRAILRLRRDDPEERTRHEATVERYRQALGMTPIEEAIERSRTADPPFLTGGEDQ